MDENEAAAIARGRDAARAFVLDHLEAMTDTVNALSSAERAGFWTEYLSRTAAVMVRTIGLDAAVTVMGNACALGAIMERAHSAGEPPTGAAH